jgi:hypothetical protein
MHKPGSVTISLPTNNIAGFSLHAVHFSRRHDRTGKIVSVHRRRLRRINNPTTNDDLTTVDFSVPSRERIIGLIRLCLEAYPSCFDDPTHECGYSAEAMQEIYNEGESIYGPNITSKAEGNMANQALDESN